MSTRWRGGDRPSDALVCANSRARKAARVRKRVKDNIPEADEACGARPFQAQRRLKSQASARTAWAASIGLAPTLVLRTWGAPRIEASLAAAAGTASSCEAGGRTGLTAQSRDLLGHRRQILCGVATRCRWAAAHRLWIKTDWMFAPWLRGCLVRLVGSELAGLLRIRVGCTRGTILNAPTEEAGRNLSLASRKTRSWLACNLGQRDTAQ
jgi:hypothetical protein